MTENLRPHPASKMYPMMRELELEQLAQNIRKIGLIHPIQLYKGEILDGRNRYAACQMADVLPQFKDVTPEVGDPWDYAYALNGPRRHCNAGQLGLAAAQYNEHCDQRDRSTKRAAAQFGISERTVGYAKVVKDKAIPEVFEKVQRGEISLNKGVEVARLPTGQQKAKLKEIESPPVRRKKDKSSLTKTASVDQPQKQMLKIKEPYEEMAQLLNRMKTLINAESAKGKHGLHIQPAKSRLLSSVRELKEAIKFVTPQKFCHRCSGSGCDLCNHSGFLTCGIVGRLQ
jgi:hypothetical protein